MNIFKLSFACISSGILSMGCFSCQDDWDDHYDAAPSSETGTETLYSLIASHAELSDFREVLDSVHVFANHRQTTRHYSDVLGADQFYTVWAPQNGTFNKDSLLQLCQTSQGDSLVEQHFLKNHIARYRHSSTTNEDVVTMLNTKTITMADSKVNHVAIEKANILSKNGILHIVGGQVDYYYNIYEGLFSLDKYKHLGLYLASYETETFDEASSLAMGVVDGKTVYADSVFISSNWLLNTYGYINCEDSTYWMFVPTQTLWDSLYAETESYYNYSYLSKGDSIHDLYAHYALMQDLIYNPRVQLSAQDSLLSTTYTKYYGGKYHVYYNAFAEGGLFSYVSDSMQCSNGVIYEMNTWPFTQEKTYFIPIKTEAEGRIYEDYETATKTLKLTRGFTSSDSVSGGYLYVVPQTTYDPYYLIYEIPSVLSGTYDVCIVMLPKTVYNPDYKPDTDKKQFRSNKFVAEIFYTGTDGVEYSVNTSSKYVVDASKPSYYVKSTAADAEFLFDCNSTPTVASTRAFTNDPYVVDTIKLATIKFPTCNFGQQNVTTRIKITNSIRNNQTNTYNAEMLIDCFYLKPHID